MAMRNPNVTVTFDSQGIRVMKRLADALEKANKISESGDQKTLVQNSFEYGREYALASTMTEDHDDETLIKVYEVLENEGLSHRTATDLVSALQNKGILFRERR